MSLWSDFKQFAFKGNVVDLAVAVVIGAAFGKIITAIVSDLITPLIGLIMPKELENFRTYVWRGFAIGDVVDSILQFLIVAFVLFIVVSKIVKGAQNRFSRKPEAGPPTTKECPFCLEIVPIKATRCKACTSQFTA